MENPFRYNTVIPGYDNLNRNQKKKRRETYKANMKQPKQANIIFDNETKAKEWLGCVNMPIHGFTITTDCFGYYVLTPCVNNANSKKEEEEKNMYSREEQQARYLEQRLYSAWNTKETDLRKQFGLTDDDPPRTGKELVERIKLGKFTLPKETDDSDDYDPDDYYGSPYSQIRWRDPATKKDRDGWLKAWNAAQKAFTDTKDAIMVKSADESLKALQKFEAATF